jgi:hypothetical protein
MKLSLSRRARQLASALLATLIIFAIFSLFLVYYLTLVGQQNLLGGRSQQWNMAMAVTEAGVEEGLQHLNVNYKNLASDGWASCGANTYYRSNSLPDGNSYAVFLTNLLNPVIVSRSYVRAPVMAQGLQAAFFAAAGVELPPELVSRTVRVTCTRGNVLLAALVAKHGIDLNGNNVRTDSFDSGDPNRSLNGQYHPGRGVGDMGDIASNDGLVDSLNLGNANIYGKAHTGVGTNTLSLGSNGGVGSHEWQATHRGIQDGWYLQDANFTFPDTTFPNTSSFLTPTGGVYVLATNQVLSASNNVASVPNPIPYGGLTTNWGTQTTVAYPNPAPARVTTNYITAWTRKGTFPAPGTYVGEVETHGTDYDYFEIKGIAGYTYPIPNSYSYNTYTTNVIYTTNYYDQILHGATGNSTNYYVATSLTGKTLVAGSNVVLALPNGLNMSGNDSILLADKANVLVYSAGTSCTIGGNGVVNLPGIAANFMLFCTESVTSFSCSGNAAFIGVLVAPEANVRMNGGGSTVFDFIGAIMVNSCTMNGHFNFHYDEALQRITGFGRFLVSSWNEI